MLKKIYIARHKGFCMGVKRAITIAEETGQRDNGRVTILNEIVHNDAVVEKFKADGVGQALSVDDVDSGTLIISAHGVAPDIIENAKSKGLNVIDATCPLVTKIYDIILEAVEEGYHVIHFGDPDHDETKGVVGYAPEEITVVSTTEQLQDLPDWEDRKLCLTVQTTAHISTFREARKIARRKWPEVRIADSVCNATTQRQSAIEELAPKVDLVLVVGSKTSANSNRLARISESICGKGRLINSAKDIGEEWFAPSENVSKVGVTAGASTPDFLVEEVIERLIGISGGVAEVIVPEKKRRSAPVERRAG